MALLLLTKVIIYDNFKEEFLKNWKRDCSKNGITEGVSCEAAEGGSQGERDYAAGACRTCGNKEIEYFEIGKRKVQSESGFPD